MQRSTNTALYDLELLGLYSSILHFRHLLEGRTFTIITDEKLLTSAFLKGKDPISPTQRNQPSFISEFCMDIVHAPGLDNVVADSLPRQYEVDQISADSLTVHAITHVLSDIDLDHLAKDKLRDEECTVAPTAITKICWQHCRFPGMRHEVLCDVSLQPPRIYVPVGWRKRIFDALLSLAHPSGKTTLEIISRDYVWHCMKKEVVNWAKVCVKCQQNKITRHTRPPTQTIPTLQDRFTHVHVDLVGPLPKSQGFEYLLTMVDCTTRWPEAILLEDSKSETVTRAFITGWCARFGVPKVIIMDRKVRFTTNLWTQVLEKLGIKASMTTTYHPQSNGMVERFHRTLKSALRCSLSPSS